MTRSAAGGPRILLVRTSALGDIVHCLPVLTALRRELPGATLGWLVEEAMAPLLAGHPDLDALITVRLRPWRKRPLTPATWREVAGLVMALDHFGAEVVLDLMGNHKAGVLGALTLADRRIGLARRYRREPSSAVWISQGVAPRGVHAVDRALSVLAGLGLATEPADFGGAKLFPDAPAPPRRSAAPVLIHPGAGWANKVYPAERWGEVARRLAAAGCTVAALSGPGEEALAARIVAASGGSAAVREAPDLPSLGGALRAARLVLGGDTGPVHLAHALGTPVLALMGPTDPATHGPYGAPERALAVRLPCSFCHQRLDGPRPCLLALEPAAVAARALELLAASA